MVETRMIELVAARVAAQVETEAAAATRTAAERAVGMWLRVARPLLPGELGKWGAASRCPFLCAFGKGGRKEMRVCVVVAPTRGLVFRLCCAKWAKRGRVRAKK